MSIRNTFPEQRPTLNLDFANSKTLDPRITFSRTTTATYVDEDGLIKYAAADEPRFDHDPVTGECLGLLVENLRANYMVNSNDFPSTSTNADANTTETISPDGNYNATKLYESTTFGYMIQFNSFSATAGKTYCASAFLKAGENTHAYFKFTDNASGGSSNEFAVDLINGVISSPNSSRGIIPYPNGWYRIYAILTFTQGAGTNSFQFFMRDGDGSIQYTGDGVSGYYVYGKQVEEGTFLTSYIPNDTGSQKTRNPDDVSMTGDNFSDWYNPSEGSILWSGGFIPENLNMQCFSIDPSVVGDANNRIALFGRSGSSSTFVPRIRSSGNNFDPSVGAIPLESGEIIKTILSYKLNSVAFTDQKTSTIASSTPTSLPTLNLIKIGSDYSGTQFTNGHISKLTYYPTRLTNAQLQTLTK